MNFGVSYSIIDNCVIFAVMRKIFAAFCIIVCSLNTAVAQYEMDFGVNLGGANYLGEIGGGSGEAQPFLLDMKLEQSQFAVGAFYRYSFTRNIAAKISLNFLRLEGADSLSGSGPRIGRNLSFRTDVFEAILTGEYNFFTTNDISRRSRQRIDFKAYAFAGIGAIYYIPYAQFEGDWYSLRPLQTEGTQNAYDEIALVVPLGVGANFTINRKLRFGMEVGYRFAFTDYLDDVSTRYAEDADLPFNESRIFANRSDEAYARGDADLPDRGYYNPGAIRGNPDGNDGYLTIQLSCSYVIRTGNDFSKPKYNSVINRRRKRTKF